MNKKPIWLNNSNIDHHWVESIANIKLELLGYVDDLVPLLGNGVMPRNIGANGSCTDECCEGFIGPLEQGLDK